MKITCPNCGHVHEENIGRLIAGIPSKARARASVLNGVLGGRPVAAKPVRLRPYHVGHPKYPEWLAEQAAKQAAKK